MPSFSFLKELFCHFQKMRWQQWIATGLSLIIVANTGLFGAVAYANTFETELNNFQTRSPEDGNEYPLVVVLVEPELNSGEVSDYCEGIQEQIGSVCLLMEWQGETAARIVESLQQLYFEGYRVSDGLAKLVGLVLIGEVPIPVVHNGLESFPSLYPYTDLVRPVYVFDPDQQIFIRSSATGPQPELWHGVIRPPGQGNERQENLERFLTKVEAFREGDQVFKDQIGFHDQLWANDAFDNGTKHWYLQKLKFLYRLLNYQFSGNWLKSLMGEATERFQDLASRTFPDAPVRVQKPSADEVNAGIGFNSRAAERERGQQVAGAEDIFEGEDMSEMPDIFSPGPIRNLLKDYIHVVSRYVSGTTEILEKAGRRQSYETLPSVITKMDRYSASIIALATREFEQYTLKEVEKIASDIELIEKFNEIDTRFSIEDFNYKLRDYSRYINGAPLSSIQEAEQCSLVRGTNYATDEGDPGKAVYSNRKDDPTTVQDISWVSGAWAQRQILETYEWYGSCSWKVRNSCVPGASTQPLLDFGAAKRYGGDNNYQLCFQDSGPGVPESVEHANFRRVSSVIHHVQPTGDIAQAMMEQKLARHLPIDAVRHASFYWGGPNQFSPEQVGRIAYPNFYALKAGSDQQALAAIEQLIESKEIELRQARVQANQERFMRYVAYSIAFERGDHRPDFWKYNEIPQFQEKSDRYWQAVLAELRPVFDRSSLLEPWGVFEQYLKAGDVAPALEQRIQGFLPLFFPGALADENLNLTCGYEYDLRSRDPFKPEPPSVSRKCDNKIAKKTKVAAKSLREFYQLPEGARVDIEMLHNADKFTDPLDPTAALEMLSFIALVVAHGLATINGQLDDKRAGRQPSTVLEQTVIPVPLVEPGELKALLQNFKQELIQAVSWLNLGIEAKHRQGLSLLAKDKEMLYLVMNGDAQHFDFTIDKLKGTYPDQQGKDQQENILDTLKKGEDELIKKQEQRSKQREVEQRRSGTKASPCGGSVGLLEWPQAVGDCWIPNELLANPIGGDSAPPSDLQETQDATGTPQAGRDLEITLSSPVLALGSQGEARIAVSAEQPIQWESEGPIKVQPQQHGVAALIPEGVGNATLRARYGQLASQKLTSVYVRVVDQRVLLQAVNGAELQAGSDQELSFAVELVSSEGEALQTNTTLKVIVDDADKLVVPEELLVRNGKGTFAVRAGTKTGMAAVHVEGPPSRPVLVNVLAGEPALLEWEPSDRVIGLDGKIDVKLLVKDGFGNPYRAEGMRTLLAFDGMRIKGDDEDAALANLKNLFLLAGELSFTADINGAAENRQIAVQSVDGFPNLRLPPPLELDPGNGYRLQWLGVPRQVFVGEEYQIGLQVSLGPNPIPLHHKTFVLRSEFAGETSSTSVVMEGQSSFVELSAPARIGTIRLTVSDQDFGDLSAEVQVLPKPVATSFQLRDVQYSESELMFRILGSDQYGNDLSLKQKLAQVKLIADGGEVLLDRSVVIQDQLSFPVARQTDRLRVEVLVDGFSQPQLAEAPLRQQLSVQELAQLPWETPFVVLGGAAFGDLRWGQNAVQSLLFGSLSQVQAVVSEATPHRGPPKVISIFPSGRPLFGPDMKMELTWDNHKPVLVFADADRELGRLLTNPDQLNFSVLRASTGFYQWSKREGRGKALLVLDSGQFEGTGLAQGDLLDSRGRKAISFDQSRLIFHDDRIQTEVIDRGVDSLVLEFSWENEVLAQWYLDFDLTQIAVGELGPLEWRFSGTQSEHLAEDFFAGESTADGVMGLNILKKSNIISYDVGEGKGLDDVYQKNGQGFTDEDKSSLSLLAGDSVGESFQQQSEGIMVFGDPVSSLQSIRHRGDGGAKVSPFDSADTNFSIGQHVYRPEGEITQLLRLDVEGDGEDDLLVLEKRGSDSIVRYLEGKGEGYRWGAVSDLLNLGPDLRDAQVVSGKHLLALYESGQLFLEENQGGRFVRKAIDLSDLGLRNQALIDLAVRDVDDDDQDDLIFITGRRELWVWYGREDSTGYVFGLQDRDQQRLKTFGMPISTAENYKTAMWLYTQITPEVEAGCRRNELVCKPGYFKGYEGGARQDDGREVDRLALLQEQAGDVGFKNVDEDDQRQFLVRLDQSELYRRFIDIDFTSHRAGDQLNLNDQIDFRVSINPRRGEEEFVLRFDLGDAFELVGQPQCQGCGDLSVTQKPGMMWSLGGRLSGGQQVSLTFSARLVQMPNFSLNILKTNGDRYPDLGVNVEGNDGPILLFQSQNRARQFVETFFGDNAGLQRRASPQRSQQDLSDLMRGVGAEGKSQEELKNLILQEQEKIKTATSDALDQTFVDERKDGFPDIFQENPLLPPSLVVPQPSAAPSTAPTSSLFQRFFQRFLPSAQADFLDGLNGTADLLENVEGQVQSVVNLLKCSRGCLPLPINFAFLAPGPINVFGTPSGFDPGLPIFGIVPNIIPVWPPTPYQQSTFRIYLSPTLTGGLGLGFCLGPWLLGQCIAFSVPLDLLGSEKLCDAAKQGLHAIIQGIYSAVGEINAVSQGVADEINKTGVIKASVNKSDVSEAESLFGVNFGGGKINASVAVKIPKINLQAFPAPLVDWWDRQWEEIYNSVTDLPDIIVRLPDFRNPLAPLGFDDGEYSSKMKEKYDAISGESLWNFEQIYDLINSLPIISLTPTTVEVQIPWIEPGLLVRVEQSLYQFLHSFMLEILAFIESFNLPCDINMSRVNWFNQFTARVRLASPGMTEEQIKALERGLKTRLDQAVDHEERLRILEKEAKDIPDAEREALSREMQELRDQIASDNARIQEIRGEILAMTDPSAILQIVSSFNGLVQTIFGHWGEQLTDFDQVREREGQTAESAEALGRCLAQKLSLELGADVTGFIESIQKNIEAIRVWKDFPRQLARYLNVLEFYMAQIIEMIDSVTNVVLVWWNEFERRLDTWIDVISAFHELVAFIQLILDILKGYNKQCGLCSTDRLTLKGLLMKIFFGIIPEFPIIDFPTWPDVRIDFSDVQLGINVTVPVFDVKTIDFRWPELPTIQLPRFKDFDFRFGFAFSVKLPEVPLVIPEPPDLPPLEPLPKLPAINLPNIPPAPEVPRVLESLLPIMRIIQTVLDIWCLINKSLLPFPENTLKTQIENLTNRSLNLILPIDLMLELNLFPGDLLSGLIPFDLINVKSTFKAGVEYDIAGKLQTVVDEEFHAPMDQFLRQIDLWMEELRGSVQQGVQGINNDINESLGDFDLDDLSSKIDVSPDAFDRLDQKTLAMKSELGQLITQRKQQAQRQQLAMRQEFEQLKGAIAQMNAVPPQQALTELASRSSDHVLASSHPSRLQWKVAAEKQQTLLNSNNFVEREIALLDKPKLIAEAQQSGNELQQVQQQMLGGEEEPDVAGLGGTVMFRDNQARRIQDYPLRDPVVQVWDNDVFLAYEGGLYLKSLDGLPQRPQAYSGAVRSASVREFQRSKVHQLAARPVASAQVSPDSATVRWSWDSPGVRHVELTVWDSVGGAQRLDLRHRRYYLSLPEEDRFDSFETLTPGLELREGETLQAQRRLRLSFGDDVLEIPDGVSFQITSLALRQIEFNGRGTVELNNLSGEAWTVGLSERMSLETKGMMEGVMNGPQQVQLPQLKSQRFISSVRGTVSSRLAQPRRDVLPGEVLPQGSFYPLKRSELERDGVKMTVLPGVLLNVEAGSNWKLNSGKGQLIVAGAKTAQQAQAGMAILDGELWQGEYEVDDEGAIFTLSSEQEATWSQVSGNTFQITVPAGNYYGRAREREGMRGFSPIVHAAAQQRFGNAQVVGGLERVRVPLYSPVQINATHYVVGNLPDQSFQWQLAGENSFVGGQVFRHPGFTVAGDKPVTLYVRQGEQGVMQKSFVIEVFLPELEVDEVLFEGSRVLQVQTVPPVANIPIGIVGARDGIQDWLVSLPALGTAEGERYLADAQGMVQLSPLAELEGLNIVIDEGRRVARLYRNGRVVINPGYLEDCRNDRMVDGDGYVKFRVSCKDAGADFIHKFDVRMIPDVDTDVSTVQEFSPQQRGVVIRSLQGAIKLVTIPQNGEFAPGGVQVERENGQVLMLLTTAGQVEFVNKNLSVREKTFISASDPLIWQLMDGSTPLAEFQIRGNGENISVIDPPQRDQLPGDIDGDGMLDRWEQTYGAFDPTLDPDQDTLSNLREFQVGTNPNKFDSDGDGASDAAELERGTDPLDALADREAVKSFPDLSEQSPYFEAVMGLTRMGYIQGYGDGTFKPNQAVSRAEALKILMSVIRCENCQSPAEQTRLQFDPADKNLEYFRQFHDGVFQGASDPLKQFAFSQDQVEARDQTIRSYFDIKLEDWFYYCVEVATDLGLVHGYRGVEGGINALGYFLPARQVNIAELMKMVIEAMGEKGAKSEVKYGLPFAWWNDPDNNYLAKAEELKLLLSQHDYLNPQREASRAEVAYAAWQILQKNKDLDLDGDGLTNERDSCPCQAETDVTLGQADGCPEDAEPGRGPVLLPPRDLPTLFSGIEIVQQLDCRCLFVVPADLFNGSTFFGVITGAGEDSDKVYVKSNEVTGPEQE